MKRIATTYVMSLSAIMFLFLAAAQPVSATTLAYDSFTRPDNTDLNANRAGADLIAPMTWTEDAFDSTIKDNALTGVPFNDNRVRETTVDLSNSTAVFVGATLTALTNDNHFGVAARMRTDGSDNYYRANLATYIGGVVELQKVVNGIPSTLGTGGTITTNVPYRVVLSVVNNQLNVYLNGTVVIGPITDTAHASGHTGAYLGISSTRGRVDNFKVATTLVEANDPNPPVTVSLSSITVTPANPTINVGQTQPFTATGTFSDGSTRVLTAGSPSPSVLAYDSFTRPDNTDLNANRSGADLIAPTNWIEDAGNGGVVSHAVRTFVGGVASWRARNTTVVFTDGFVGADVRDNTTVGNNGIRLNARSTPDGMNPGYQAGISVPSDILQLTKATSGVQTILATMSGVGLVKNVTYRVVLEVTGNTLKLYLDGVLKLSATDSEFTSGHTGFQMDGGQNDFPLDNFKVAMTFAEANDPNPPAGVLAYDSFTRPDNTDLNANRAGVDLIAPTAWVEDAGDEAIFNGRLRTDSGIGLNAGRTRETSHLITDGFVGGDLSTSGNATLLAIRAKTDGTKNKYFAGLLSGTIKLLKVVNGSETVLATGSTYSPNTIYRIVLGAVGNQLRVYKDGVLDIGPITDNDLTSGHAGTHMDASADAFVDNFKVATTFEAANDPNPPSGSTGEVTWTSSNTAVATINQTGLATGVSPGMTTITATAAGITGSTTSASLAPVSHWPAEGNANDAVDANHGTLQGGTTFAAGKIGQAFSFDGADDQVTVPFNANLNLNGSFTIEGWVNFDTLTNEIATIAERRETVFPYYGWAVKLNGASPNKFVFEFKPGPNPVGSEATGATTPVVGTWYHVAGVFDAGAGVMRLYVNGVQESSTAEVAQTLFAQPAAFVIGAGAFSGELRRRLDGLVDELSIYNRALSPEEVRTRFDGGISGSTTLTVRVFDTTPPVITPSVSPQPNANGWNNTDVTVSWSVMDPESGITSSIGCSTTVLTAETPGTLLTCSATNGAGLSSSTSVTIKIDKTAPEAMNQFDPATRDVVVLGRDSLSGVPAGPIAPLSVIPTRWGRGEDDDNGHGNAELRTYLIQDAAGNTLTLVEIVKREGHELQARIVSLQYNAGPVITPTRNKKAFEWGSTKTGSLKELEQKLTLGRGPTKHEVQAKYEAKKDQTTIKQKNLVQTKQVFPGLVLLRFVTSTGSLTIEF